MKKQEKGITLVALIITIIVLLILAVVAIGAVQNDGIIGHAKESKKEYQAAQTNEETSLGNHLEKIEANDPGTVEAKEDAEELELMERYVLGIEKIGKVATQILNLGSNYQVNSFNDDEETIKKASEEITPLFTALGENNAVACVYAKYKDKVYKIEADFTSYMTTDVKMIYKPEGREGEVVKYDSDGKNGPEDWVIITDRNKTVEIVSADVMYGENGTGLKVVIDDTIVTSDLDGDGEIGNYGDIGIASYNKAVATINNYCKSIVTAETDKSKVRSIGLAVESEEIEEGYSSTNFNSWFKNSETVKVRKGDTEFEEDLAKMYYYGITDTEEDYWIASRLICELEAKGIRFYVRSQRTMGFINEVDWNNSLYLSLEGEVQVLDHSYGVHPVVINPSGI